MKNRFKVTSVLVFTGTALMNTAYVPKPKAKPSKDLIESVYIAPTRFQRWNKSEVRKMQILNNLNKVREEIRTKARNRYTTTGYNYGTIAIHSHNLIESILKAKS